MAKKNDEEMKTVVATSRGFYDALRDPGDTFEVPASLKASWFKDLDEDEIDALDADADKDPATAAKPAAKSATKAKAKPAEKVEAKAKVEDKAKAGPFADAPEPIRAKHPVNDETGGTKPDWIG